MRRSALNHAKCHHLRVGHSLSRCDCPKTKCTGRESVYRYVHSIETDVDVLSKINMHTNMLVFRCDACDQTPRSNEMVCMNLRLLVQFHPTPKDKEDTRPRQSYCAEPHRRKRGASRDRAHRLWCAHLKNACVLSFVITCIQSWVYDGFGWSCQKVGSERKSDLHPSRICYSIHRFPSTFRARL
jgi:hypothetical protein